MYKNLRDFYDNIDNPLVRNDFYKELIKSYSDVYNYKFANSISISDENNEKIKQYFKKSVDNYYVYLFNLWKNNIINTNFVFYNAENEMNILREYLKTLPDAKNAKNVFDYINPNDSSLKMIIDKYCFRHYEFDKWNNISSDNFFCVSDCSYLPEHILVLNTKYYDTLNFCKYFQRKCIEKNLAFSYSFYMGDSYKDKVIIKTDTEHILDYLSIIKEIEIEYPKLIKRCDEPSIFTGRVNNYIGYGSLENENVNSFYTTRINHTNRCIELITYEFLKRNYKNKIKGNKNSIFLIDYLSSIITFNYIDNLKTKVENDYPNLVNENLDSRKLFEHIVKYVKINLIKQLEKKYSFSELSDFNVYYRSNLGRNTFTFTQEFIHKTIKENTIELFKINPNLYFSLKRLITRSARNYNISDKYCLDTKTLNDLFNQYDKLLLPNSYKNNK